MTGHSLMSVFCVHQMGLRMDCNPSCSLMSARGLYSLTEVCVGLPSDSFDTVKATDGGWAGRGSVNRQGYVT
jgi:hypothetical protein